ncbi:DUF421 domain-containing protein [Pararhizobium mangrovi]|uniref:DUF421 domain-containing protein n=1 Tax=Pararhizobium mangrovi TaxID=2590452 RepID=A0A506U6A9_9HYPH|nr:YetF domain-containing protein [Pararhizobium mangrovi]TPW28139.1 DUF421 domain-containing protein [Pararhizobium mangrovi]
MATEWFLPAAWSDLAWVVISTVGMYCTILALARLSGVRSFAEMSAFDVAVTIAVGSLLATSIATRNPPLLQGVVAMVSLYGLQLVLSRLRRHYRGVSHITDNAPIQLMGRGGVVYHVNMDLARVTEDDLRTHLRKANVVDPKRVEAVVMEGTGEINVLHGHGGGSLENAWILRDVRNYDEGIGRPSVE